MMRWILLMFSFSLHHFLWLIGNYCMKEIFAKKLKNFVLEKWARRRWRHLVLFLDFFLFLFPKILLWCDPQTPSCSIVSLLVICGSFWFYWKYKNWKLWNISSKHNYCCTGMRKVICIEMWSHMLLCQQQTFS